MKKTTIIIILLSAFISQNIHCQMKTRLNSNDWMRMRLNGKIFTMKSREYEVTINKDSTLSLKLNFEPFLNSHYDFIYDKKGFLTNKKAYFARKDSLVTAEIWDYVYDKKHRIIIEKKLSSGRISNENFWYYSYLDKNITLIEEKDKFNPITFYKYIQKGQIEELATKQSETEYKKHSTWFYDNRDRIYRKNLYVGDTIYSSNEFQYIDRKRNNITIEKYISKGKTNFFSENQYDNQNNIVAIYNSNKKLIQSFDYVYDNKNNWIEKKTFNKNGKLLTITKREIVYY